MEEQLFEQIKRLIEQNPEKYSRQELAKELGLVLKIEQNCATSTR